MLLSYAIHVERHHEERPLRAPKGQGRDYRDRNSSWWKETSKAVLAYQHALAFLYLGMPDPGAEEAEIR